MRTLMPPRPGIASTGRCTEIACGAVSCRIVAWYVRSGIAGMTVCDIFSASCAAPPATATVPSLRSAASICHANLVTPIGTVTSHVTSRASPGASSASLFSSAAGVAPGVSGVTRAVTATSMRFSDALRTVAMARKRSPSRTTGGRPESSIRSCVERIDASPVPKSPAPEDAMATILKLVSESLSGISTLAFPAASRLTRAFHNSSVSNSSRADERPPPPPAAIAFLPKWRLPITCVCAVDVSTSSPRRVIIASSSFHVSLGRSSSRPSSTAATATSLPAGGALPSARRTAMATLALSRTL